MSATRADTAARLALWRARGTVGYIGRGGRDPATGAINLARPEANSGPHLQVRRFACGCLRKPAEAANSGPDLAHFRLRLEPKRAPEMLLWPDGEAR